MNQKEALKLLYQELLSRRDNTAQGDPDSHPELPDLYSSYRTAPVMPSTNAFSPQYDQTQASDSLGSEKPKFQPGLSGVHVTGKGPVNYDAYLKYSGDANVSTNTPAFGGNLGINATRNNGDTDYRVTFSRPLFGGNININAFRDANGNNTYGIKYMKSF